MLGNRSTGYEDRRLDFPTSADPPKPSEAMPPYRIVTFPTYKPPPEILAQGGSPVVSMQSNKTPKHSAGSPPSPLVIPKSQSDTPKADKPSVTWNGGKSITQNSLEEKPNTLVKM